ncbi:MAG TPA: class I SAM-dependent methyltransferase [Gemmatimonadaceae bacterium]|nr:class I SAM-dependent methyltransferase [Gemmatimonadaceae bacterium]
MDADYGQAYRDLYRRHWWWRARESLIVRTLRARLAGRRGNVLDVGCGDGLFFDRLAEFGDVVEGVEPAAALVSSDGPHRGAITIAPFDERFRPGKRYALIVMLDVLEHMPEPARALRHALSLLEPDGTFLATVPAFEALWTTHDDVNHHYTRYTRASFAALAAESGLRIDAARYFFHWTFPAKLLTRALEAVTRPTPASPRVPPAAVNEALYRLSLLEQRTLGRLPLPFGSSLMVVGGRAADG